ncbi:hypothetical protein HDG41_004710 [Paraburkholderia sp. JPY162]|uniref:Uncharacterized protein n=1 Tax=Paraburkholderia youngii TaxID=2782701 RepID=A0A7W8LBJ6_9BURK|nr:hypothetical protein [Paraburkholderia youngii]
MHRYLSTRWIPGISTSANRGLTAPCGSARRSDCRSWIAASHGASRTQRRNAQAAGYLRLDKLVLSLNESCRPHRCRCDVGSSSADKKTGRSFMTAPQRQQVGQSRRSPIRSCAAAEVSLRRHSQTGTGACRLSQNVKESSRPNSVNGTSAPPTSARDTSSSVRWVRVVFRRPKETGRPWAPYSPI